MNQISFDIIYKKKLDNASIKLPMDSEFQQLKIMICGKYKIYDINNLYIYYKNNLLINDDLTKIKEIFKNQRAKIEIKDSPKSPSSSKKEKKSKDFNLSNKEQIKDKNKCFCKCKNVATNICDRCNELLCDKCIRKNKHLGHSNLIIKLSEYHKHFKMLFNKVMSEVDKKIISDETFQFLKYWDYDVTREINNIDNIYEYIKKQLEDIKQIQIDYILSIGQNNKYDILKQQIELVVSQFENLNNNVINNNFNNNSITYEKLLEHKKNFETSSQEIIEAYGELKDHLLLYTKAVKEIELFNEIYIKYSTDRFNIIKKNYSQIPLINSSKNNLLQNNGSFIFPVNNNNNNFSSSTSISNINNSIMININNNIANSPRITAKQKDNNSSNSKNIRYMSPVVVKNNEDILGFLDIEGKEKDKYTPSLNNASSPSLYNTSSITQTPQKANDKMIFKLKDEKKIIIFSLNIMGFKEKNYIDKCNFSKEIKPELDIIQINLFSKLFLLGGNSYNKFYYYDYLTNCINFINNTLYTHYFGSFVFCNKYNMLYLIGGNPEKNNEICYINSNIKKISWSPLPCLNEERREFASLYYDDYIYVFFGFSPKTKSNLSSIERINVNTNDRFEVVYINEQITINCLGCAKFVEDGELGENKECILLLGGFNGENYIDSTLALNVQEMKIRDCEIVIPNITKHTQFLFQKESAFVEIEPGIQVIYDTKNNVHLLTKESYELFTEK